MSSVIAPPFTHDTALHKVQMAEDLWNTRDPERIALAYTVDVQWRNRENRMAVSFEYEWHDDSGQWFRSYGTELWEFSPDGLMQRRLASINDAPLESAERRIHHPLETAGGLG